jgi:hypothetical protein
VDLNQLLFHHQHAQMASQSGETGEQLDWSRHRETFFAGEITRARGVLGRHEPFTWIRGAGRVDYHG